jgi:hypothetical protein
MANLEEQTMKPMMMFVALYGVAILAGIVCWLTNGDNHATQDVGSAVGKGR